MLDRSIAGDLGGGDALPLRLDLVLATVVPAAGARPREGHERDGTEQGHDGPGDDAHPPAFLLSSAF